MRNQLRVGGLSILPLVVALAGSGYAQNQAGFTPGSSAPATTPNATSHREDYDFARAFILEHALDQRAGHVLLSPAFSKSPSPLRTIDNATLDPRTLVEWMMADGIDARLSLQIHKFIWEPMKKGV